MLVVAATKAGVLLSAATNLTLHHWPDLARATSEPTARCLKRLHSVPNTLKVLWFRTLKRMTSILRKLQRETVTLSWCVDDIGGCRLIVAFER